MTFARTPDLWIVTVITTTHPPTTLKYYRVVIIDNFHNISLTAIMDVTIDNYGRYIRDFRK